jgi:hypothetical protein
LWARWVAEKSNKSKKLAIALFSTDTTFLRSHAASAALVEVLAVLERLPARANVQTIC